jgi:hypothetical protein
MRLVPGVVVLGDLVKPAVEPRHGIRNAAGALVRLHGARFGARVRHLLKLPRQRIEAFVDGGEAVADVALVLVFSVWSGLLSHAFPRIAEMVGCWKTNTRDAALKLRQAWFEACALTLCLLW